MRKSAALFFAAAVFSTCFAVQGLDLKTGDAFAILSGQGFNLWSWAPSGYARLVMARLHDEKVDPQIIFPEGLKAAQMLERVDNDVIAKKAVVAILMPGTADYNPWTTATVDEAFLKSVERTVEKLKAANVKVFIATSLPAPGDLNSNLNKSATVRNEALRELAKKQGVGLVDVAKAIAEAPQQPVPLNGNVAASALASQICALEIMRALGESDADLAALREAWLTQPKSVQLMPSVSSEAYARLKEKAKAKGVDVSDLMAELLHQKAKEL